MRRSPSTCFCIQSFDITLFAQFQWRINKHFQKLAFGKHTARHIALRTVWRNKRHQHNQAGIDHQLRYFRHATNIFHTIGFGKS